MEKQKLDIGYWNTSLKRNFFNFHWNWGKILCFSCLILMIFHKTGHWMRWMESGGFWMFFDIKAYCVLISWNFIQWINLPLRTQYGPWNWSGESTIRAVSFWVAVVSVARLCHKLDWVHQRTLLASPYLSDMRISWDAQSLFFTVFDFANICCHFDT